MDARSLSHLHIAAVGEKTAAYLKKHGITADLIPAVSDGVHMAREATQMLAGNGAVLILEVQPSGGGQESVFQGAGVRCTRVPLYESLRETAKNAALAATLSQGPLYVLFTRISAV